MKSAVEGGVEHFKKLCALQDVKNSISDEFENYDVFISHRGLDTKTSFAGYLYDGLKRVGLCPFLDCKSIGKGQDSWKCIDHAIRTTPLAVVIFSEDFTQSEWCLREVHTILNSLSVVKVLPIFYKVEPSGVKFPEKGQLDGIFTMLVKKYGQIVIDGWKVNLEKASLLNGWEYKVGDKRLEMDFVLEVVGKIFELANKPLPLYVGDHIVGVKRIAKNLIRALDEKKVMMLGLWGMGGIGKSTLAWELYNQLGRRFDVRCYVGDVAEKVNQGGVTSVQNHILKALCENESIQNIVDKSEAKVILEERLSKKSILLVLDDAIGGNEMDYLISRKMLKGCSMCIVTSRNRRVFEKLTSFHDKHEILTHEVQILEKEDSRSVFACHAFGGDLQVPRRFEHLVQYVSMACGGVPLVLKVCGSLLRDEEDVETWKEVLKKLNCGTIMDDKKIFKCLRISYDSLEEEHQEMFLDIACALLGASVEMAKLVWRSQGWSATLGVRSLVEKALIRVDEQGAFCMHDHLRDMGHAVSKQERSSVKRLWGSESLAMLNRNEALPDSLRIFILPRPIQFQVHLSLLQSLSFWWFSGIRVNLSLMKGLRIFKCEGCYFLMSSLPKNLSLLDYRNCKSMHGHFPQAPQDSEMVILSWSDSSLVQLPKSFGNLKKLERLCLRDCFGLLGLPDSFSGLQNLKNLDLQGSGLQCLPTAFGKLCKLEVLNLERCKQLKKLPDSFGDLQNLKNLNLEWTVQIQCLPLSFVKLSNLEVLNLEYCLELKELPHLFGDLKSLKILNLGWSGIQCLPASFGKLSNLQVLRLNFCIKFKELLDSFRGLQNLKTLCLQFTDIKCAPTIIGKLSNLEELSLQGCSKHKELWDSFQASQS